MASFIPCPDCKATVQVGNGGKVKRHGNCPCVRISVEELSAAKSVIEEIIAEAKRNPAKGISESVPDLELPSSRPFPTAVLPPDPTGVKMPLAKRKQIEKERAKVFAARRAWVKANKQAKRDLIAELDAEQKPYKAPGVRSIVSGGAPSLGKKR